MMVYIPVGAAVVTQAYTKLFWAFLRNKIFAITLMSLESSNFSNYAK